MDPTQPQIQQPRSTTSTLPQALASTTPPTSLTREHPQQSLTTPTTPSLRPQGTSLVAATEWLTTPTYQQPVDAEGAVETLEAPAREQPLTSRDAEVLANQVHNRPVAITLGSILLLTATLKIAATTRRRTWVFPAMSTKP